MLFMQKVILFLVSYLYPVFFIAPDSILFIFSKGRFTAPWGN